jgi:hypothetical protein
MAIDARAVSLTELISEKTWALDSAAVSPRTLEPALRALARRAISAH